MAEVDVYLVRHGQSLSNVEGRLCGEPPGPGLTELGRRQAETAATSLMGQIREPLRVVTSPLLRTWQTADALSRKLGRPATIVGELRETSFGAWEGKRLADLADLPEYGLWAADPDRPPAWVEGAAPAGLRVASALSSIAAAMAGGAIVAYSHQHPILGFVRRLGVDAQESWVKNAAVAHAIWRDGTWRWVGMTAGPEPACTSSVLTEGLGQDRQRA